MQLLGEEINTQVSVLACGRRGGDTDDLAWTTLEDQEIAETDVMAGDSDGVGGVGGLSGGGGGASTARYELGSVSCTSYGNVNLFPLNRVMIVMMMMRTT
jgi:glycerate-2-kinase